MSWKKRLAEKTPIPEAACFALEEIEQLWEFSETSFRNLLLKMPEEGVHLAHLLGFSPISRSKILRDPEALLWLVTREGGWENLGETLQKRIQAESPLAGGEALRRMKSRELLRIAYREVAGSNDIRRSGEELSQLAAKCVREVWEEAGNKSLAQFGNVGEGAMVIGMGKLGGWELNYSSDIDLMFLYGIDAEIKSGGSRQQYFERLCARFVKEFTAPSPWGSLFRVDLRLRPEGDSGAMVCSFSAMENYYAGYGETWERMALMKARRICGPPELAYEFEKTLQSFIYPRTLSPDLLDEVAAIKERIERKQNDLQRNVKLGRGGIREIEFIIQTLQLLHGARHAFLQQRSTLKALESLAMLDLMPLEDARCLRDAYMYLRKVEHRLQMVEEQQTHTLPDDPEKLVLIVKSLGFSGLEDFESRHHQMVSDVRRIFEQLLSQGEQKLKPLERPSFEDEIWARKRLGDLGASHSDRHVSARTRRLYRRLEPLLLERLSKTVDPDMTLRGFVDFVEAYGIRGLLYESLSAHPRLLDLLIRLFDASVFLSQIAIRKPHWIEVITRSGQLAESWDVATHLRELSAYEEKRPPEEALRLYRKYHALRLGLREILQIIDNRQFFVEYTALAEACLMRAAQIAGCDEETQVIAFGKFGAGELSYGADLDIVILGKDLSCAEKLLKIMNERTSEGLVFPVDMRLRPDGVGGPLLCTLDAYTDYLSTRAQLWEKQALTRARVILGKEAQKVDSLIASVWRNAGKEADLFKKIYEMFEKIRVFRSGEKADFKTGEGGIVQLEFLVQSLQMHYGIREVHTWSAIEKLGTQGFLDAEKSRFLKKAYSFLRNLEKVQRRMDDRPDSEVSNDPIFLQRLAMRVGYSETKAFLQEWETTRKGIDSLFQSLLV